MKRAITIILLSIVFLNNTQAQCDTGITSDGNLVNNNTFNYIQSFQVSCTGKLNTIVLTPSGSGIISISNPGVGFSLRLLNQNNGFVADGIINGSTYINSWSSGNTYTFDFSAANITINANTTYKWELYEFGGNPGFSLLKYSEGNPYSSGIATIGGVDLPNADLNNWIVNISELLSSDSFQKKNIKVHPNPSTGIFTIDNDNVFGVEIFDYTGKIVWKNENDLNLQNIDLSSLPSGIYFAKVYANDYQLNTVKLIKE
jgi:hypothetical protein